MEYNWDIKDLTKLKKLYHDTRFKTKDLTKLEKEYLLEQEKDIQDMIDTVKYNTTHLSFNSFLEIGINDYLTKDNIKNYLSVSKWLRSYLMKSIPLLKYCNEEDIYNLKLNLSDQDLVTLSKDFFNWLPDKNLKQLVDKYTNSHNHFLRICKTDFLEDYGSTSFFFLNGYTPYFEVKRVYNINDFYALNHELAHGIYSIFDNDSLNNDRTYLRELEGFYLEYLSSLYLYEHKIISKKELEFLASSHLSIYHNNIATLYFTYLTIKLTKEKIDITIPNIYKILLEKDIPFHINESLLTNYLEEDLKVICRYAFSYLISLYLKDYDLEKGFDMFNKIRLNRNNNILETLENNGIILDNYDVLKREIKRLN